MISGQSDMVHGKFLNAPTIVIMASMRTEYLLMRYITFMVLQSEVHINLTYKRGIVRS